VQVQIQPRLPKNKGAIMLNKERIEKKNAAKEAAIEVTTETPEVAVLEAPVVVAKKDRSAIKCRNCGKVIAEVADSGNGNGPDCGVCWKQVVK
jgi:hypothetical protein